MRTVQRRFGEPIRIWKTKETKDLMGNIVKYTDDDSVHEIRAVVKPERSSRAEVPGQQVVNVVSITTESDLSDVELWSRVELRGKEWDPVSPPQLYYGATRHVRHWSITLRERP